MWATDGVISPGRALVSLMDEVFRSARQPGGRRRYSTVPLVGLR
jgi:hypothetical protein